MVTSVRRLHGRRVAVEFGRSYAPGSTTEAKLREFAAKDPDVRLIETPEGVSGVECEEKAYVEFLGMMNASKDAIRAFRAALDDSRKATRERMRR